MLVYITKIVYNSLFPVISNIKVAGIPILGCICFLIILKESCVKEVYASTLRMDILHFIFAQHTAKKQL